MSKFIGTPFPDCTKCSRPGGESVRERWGCETAAANPVFYTSCTCGGAWDCEKCEGSNELAHMRCPSNLIADAGHRYPIEVDRMMRAYVQYDQRHVLPGAGAWGDQTASFAACVSIIDAERGWWESKRQEKLERDRKAQEMRAQKRR